MKKSFTCLFLFAASMTANAQTVVNFSYTGSAQTFTVPACVTSLTINASGAQGGKPIPNAPGGLGGNVQCTLPVTPGDVLQINVGGKGMDGNNVSGVNTGGFNGGGNGFDDADNWGGGAGGGASDIRKTPYDLPSRAVIAGGGGGGGVDGCGSGLLAGGAGGGLIAANGAPSTSSCVGSGQGGTQSAGGLKGQYPSCVNNSFDGTLGVGGTGWGDCGNDSGGSGGGGGYYGGGAGNFGAGGGGSSFTDVSCTGVVHAQGTQTGNGSVSLTFTSCTGVSFNTLPEVQVNVFPVPFTSSVNVNVNITDVNSEMSLFNSVGAKCGTWKIISGTNTIDTHELAAGIYILKVQTPSGIVTKKIIKQN